MKYNNNIPQYLYHATYRPLLKKIKQLGLGNTKRTYWQDSKPGVVYLANDPDVAESYADANQNLRNEDWLDYIIIFKIDTSKLDKTKLFVDQNVKLDEGEQNSTWEYHGIIPWQNLELLKNNIYQSKFNIVYESIMNQLKNVKYFNTLEQAKDFLNKNFNGHGTIYNNKGEVLQTCRCMKSIHEKMGIPKIIVQYGE